jgi:hypothetical protein
VGRRWLLLAASVVLIALATLAPFGAIPAEQVPPRWCVACGGLWLTDGISNVVLFAPFGVALALLGVRWWGVLALSAGLSFGVEYLQSIGIPPARSAAWADVIANALGGALGAVLCAAGRGWWLPQSPNVARRLALGYAAVVVAIFALTSAAMGPRWPGGAGAAPVYAASPFPHTPHRGWFGGQVDSLRVNGYATTHRGTGPVIVQVSREPATVAMRLWLRGRDEGTALVPIGYLHVRGDSSAVAFVAQEGLAARLVVTRRAWDWGLAMPVPQLDGVFAARSVTDPGPVELAAWSAPDTLRLSARSAAFSGTQAVALTPLIGWSLIQTVFEICGRFQQLAHLCWLAVLMMPIGWWGMHSGPRGWGVLVVAAAWVVAGAMAAPRWFGVAPVGVWDWVAMAGLLAAGTAAGRYAATKRALRHQAE